MKGKGSQGDPCQFCVRFCGVLIVILVLITILLIPVSWLFSFADTEKVQEVDRNLYKRIHHLNTQTQDEWDDVLLHAPIERIVSEGFAGLATKYLLVFESGHIAVAKVVEPFALFPKVWETITYNDIARYEAVSSSYSRAGRKFQAWTEVAAYIVSRIAFPVAKKPPAFLRAIPSSLLYNCEGCNSWREYLISWLPEHTVYISVHAYLDSMKVSPPNTNIMEHLTHTPQVMPFANRNDDFERENAKLASDVIVFDVLIDDHDRKRGHNWMRGPDSRLMLWDSGLSFQHGPIGKDSCKNLFCGPEAWQDHGKNVFNLKKCAKMCRFRKQTIDRLKDLRDDGKGDSLGFLVKKRIEEIGTPIFEWNRYYQFSSHFPEVSFLVNDFYEGLDKKLEGILSHVDYCISKHGEQNVWIE